MCQKLKLIVNILLIATIPISLKAQTNLVLNGSFEQHDSCPNSFDQIRLAKFWDAIDTNYVYLDSVFTSLGDQYPEYINTCGSGFGKAPSNANFYHYPHTLGGMVQSSIFNDYHYTAAAGVYFFNYLQGRLVSHLIAGQSYCVTFYVVNEPVSQYSINKIGAYLDDGTIDTTQTPARVQSQYTPQVLDTNVIYDTLNWTRIQGSFVANGTEKFLTIGMFFDTGHVTYVDNLYSGSHLGTYLIDDVSVIASNTKAYAGRDTTINLGDSVRLGPTLNGDGMPCYWYKLGITTAIDSGGNTWVKPAATTSYVVRMDLCGTVTYDTVKVNVGHVGVNIGSMTQWLNGSIYPNPASASLTFDGLNGCNITILNMVGQVVRDGFLCRSDKETIDIAALPKGVYVVQLGKDGERKFVRVVKE